MPGSSNGKTPNAVVRYFELVPRRDTKAYTSVVFAASSGTINGASMWLDALATLGSVAVAASAARARLRFTDISLRKSDGTVGNQTRHAATRPIRRAWAVSARPGGRAGRVRSAAGSDAAPG